MHFICLLTKFIGHRQIKGYLLGVSMNQPEVRDMNATVTMDVLSIVYQVSTDYYSAGLSENMPPTPQSIVPVTSPRGSAPGGLK